MLRWLTCLGVFSVSSVAFAQEPGIRLQRNGAPRLETAPGQAVSAVFRITNLSAAHASIRTRAALPQGWRLVIPADSLALAPRESEMRIVSMAVPATAAAGTYVVRYSAASGWQVLWDSITVIVREQRKLEMRLLDAPRFSVAGNAYTASFLLSNAGNAAALVRLSMRSGHNLPARTDSSTLRLPAGEARKVSVTVSPDRKLPSKLRHTLELRAVMASDSTVNARASSGVDVIPRSQGSPRFHRLPVQAKVRMVDPSGVNGPSEVSGAGKLFQGGSTWVDFLVRRPGLQHSAFGEVDEYRASIRGDGYELRLGDNAYQLSPLTGFSNYGFGAGGRASAGRWTAGAFAQRNRRYGDEERWGASVDYRMWRTSQFGVNYLSRTGYRPGQLGTVRALLKPFAWSTLDAEYGRGLGPAARNAGHSVHVFGGIPRLSYNFQHLRGDSAFPGDYKGARQDQASVMVRPWRQLYARAQYSMHGRERIEEQSRLAGLLPGLLGEHRRNTHQATVGYGSLLSVGYNRHEAETQASTIRVDREAESVQLRAGLPFGRLSLSPTAEVGSTYNRNTEERSRFQRLGLQSSFNPRNGPSLSASVEQFTGGTLYSMDTRDGIAASLNASMQYRDRTRGHLSLNTTRYGGATPLQYNFLDTSLEQQVAFGHRLAARARVMSFSGSSSFRQNAFLLDYVIPLGVPVSRAGAGGRIAGRIYDAETGAAVPNVLVNVGDFAVLTDRRGEFAFSGLKPDTYYVQLDRATTGAGRVTTEEMPSVVIHSGQRTGRVAIGLVRAARLAGTITRFAFVDQSGLANTNEVTEDGAFPNAVLELSRPGQLLRRVSDSRGRFDFSDVPAGQWRLAVIAADLPAQHYLDLDSLSLELRPGAVQEVSLRVLPKRRSVQIITQGEIVLETPNGATPPMEKGAAIRQYTVRPSDRNLMNIALKVYGSASMWPKIWLANQHQIRTPAQIRAGQVLNIPEKAPLTSAERKALRDFQVRER